MHPRMLAACIAAGSAALLAGCAATGSDAGADSALPDFYTASAAELPGPPGSLIRAQPMPALAPPGAQTYRLLYRSTGLRGEPVAVSAILVVPTTPTPAPAAGRPVVAWNHPTSGVARRCAPSLSPDVPRMIAGLPEMLGRGYAVVATDYPGLGTVGPHPYLFGASEGRAVLDAVRAAHGFAPAQAGTRFVVWGHSQGGHASLFAAALAPDYAPELQLLGVAAAAPATDLTALLRTVPGSTTNSSLTAMVIASWSQLLDTPPGAVVRGADLPNVERLAATCIPPPYAGPEQPPVEADPDDARFTLLQNVATFGPWAPWVAANSPPPPPRAVPAFLALGSADITVPPAVTSAYAARLCSAGGTAHTVALPGVEHRFVAHTAAPLAVRWMDDRFAGRPAPNDCGKPAIIGRPAS